MSDETLDEWFSTPAEDGELDDWNDDVMDCGCCACCGCSCWDDEAWGDYDADEEA